DSLGTTDNPAQPTNYVYDALENLRQVTQGTQQRFFMYDSLSRLIRARNPEQAVNPALNLTDSITGNSQWSAAYSHDEDGNLTQKTDARGVVSNYTYDALNRNTSVTYTNDPMNTPAVHRYYDGLRDEIDNNIPNSKGRLWQTETAGTSRTTINGYDALGRPTSQSQQSYVNNAWGQSFTVSAIYDKAGHLFTLTYPSNHLVSYNYDGAGRLADKDAQHLAFTGNLGDGTPRTYSAGDTYSPFGGLTQEQFG